MAEQEQQACVNVEREPTEYERGLRDAMAVCKEVMKESDSYTADSEDYRIGNWAGAEKCCFRIGCLQLRQSPPSQGGNEEKA